MLFSTGSQSHADELANSLRSVTAGSDAHVRGTLALARWSLHRDRPDDGLRHLDRVAPPSNHALRIAVDLCRVDCHCALGDGQTALSLLSAIFGRQTDEHDLALRVGHARALLDSATDHGSGPMVEALNTIYHGAGLGLLRRTLVIAPIGLGNISSDVPDAEPADHLPRVTVVVRLPDDATDLVGISSLVGQSWRNLEVLVAAGAEVRDRLTALDPKLSDDDRVVFVDCTLDNDHPLMPGLTHGTGDLITTHPPDSWAHPQRIEAQASAHAVDPGIHGTFSSHMNVADLLVPRPLGLVPKEHLVGPNPKSVMVRVAGREPDEVMAEYDRIQASHSPVTGELRILQGMDLVNEDVPLTLSRERLASVTATRTAIPS